MCPPPPQQNPWRPNWIAVGICAGLCSFSLALDSLMFPEEHLRGQPTVMALVGTLTGALAHALWISADRQRLGKRVGAWRFLSFFLGPLAALAHLLIHYRLRGLPYFLVYLVVWVGVGGLGLALAAGLGAVLPPGR